MAVILETEELSKQFGGLTAVNKVSLQIEKGEVRALIGPNGSGKTTFLNMVSGIYTPTSGRILFKGESSGGLAPHLITAKGISRTFQNIRLFRDLSVLENVVVGRHCRIQETLAGIVASSPSMRTEEGKAREKAMDLLRFVGLDRLSSQLARNLPYGQQRLLEIARALASSPELLLLDEPAAGMNPREKEHLLDLIGRIRDLGTTILLVEHNMRVVMTISDRISVLDFGVKIAEGTAAEVQANKDVIEAYLGRGMTYASA